MQTFLPYANFEQSAKVLDYRRLGKQRVEAWQIYRALIGQTKGWSNHPATRMWKKHPIQLLKYGIAMCNEWIARGYKDNLKLKFEEELATYHFSIRFYESKEYPEWFGKEEFHKSHQSNLIRKLPEYYKKYWPDIPDDLPYVWPVQKEK